MLSNKCQQLTHVQQEGASCTILLKGKNSAPETHEILEKALLIYADLCLGPEVGLFGEAREELFLSGGNSLCLVLRWP